MFRDIPSIRFGVTDGRKANVFQQPTRRSHGRPGLRSLVGTQLARRP